MEEHLKTRLIEAFQVIDFVELQLLAVRALISQQDEAVCNNDIEVLLTKTIEYCRHDI